MLTRRHFLGTSASTGLLSACAGLPNDRLSTASRASLCLPRVDVDRSRVIRTVAGLRPYRAAGFVVRREPLGDKVLVHNYGHGGAGITLSWGSSRLALNLAPDDGRKVAVLGAGIMGITTALLAQERGHDVTVYAADLPPDTTSNIAGGQIHPASHYRAAAVTDAWRTQYAAALGYSWRRWQIYVGDDYGVRWLTTYESEDDPPRPPSPPLDLVYPGLRYVPAAQSPFPSGIVSRYSTMYVETGRCLRRLEADFRRAGGRIVVRHFDTPADIAALDESVVFNCTGLGAHALFGDDGLEPVRGQLAILLPQPGIDYAYSLRGGYMFPRPDGIILGGTFEHGEWDAVTTAAGIDGILRRHQALNSGCAV